MLTVTDAGGDAVTLRVDEDGDLVLQADTTGPVTLTDEDAEAFAGYLQSWLSGTRT